MRRLLECFGFLNLAQSLSVSLTSADRLCLWSTRSVEPVLSEWLRVVLARKSFSCDFLCCLATTTNELSNRFLSWIRIVLMDGMLKSACFRWSFYEWQFFRYPFRPFIRCLCSKRIVVLVLYSGERSNFDRLLNGPGHTWRSLWHRSH